MDSIQINRDTDNFIRAETLGNGGMTVEVAAPAGESSSEITLSEAQAKQLTDWLSAHVQP